MATIMLLGDCHLMHTSPSTYIGSYLDDTFDILYATVELAKERNVSAVVQAGDFFDKPTPSQTPHSVVQRAIEWLRAYDCPIYVTCGNHDVSAGRLDSIYETQPLGSIFLAGVATDLRGWADEFPIYGVPWQQRWHDDAVEQAFEEWNSPQGVRNQAKSLVVTHAPLFPPGEEPAHLPNFTYYPTDKWAKAMGNKGNVLYGHIHEPHGTYTVDGVTFCNNGAISRGSIAEYNLKREIYATLWDTKTGKFERVTLPSKPASEVFRVEKKRDDKATQQKLDEFMASINKSNIEVTSIEAVRRHIREELDLDETLVEIIEELLLKAQNELSST